MLEVLKTTAFVTIGVTLGLVILAYVLYIVFYPLLKTVEGGLQLLGVYSKKEAAVEETGLVPQFELGLTLADGGEKVQDEEPEEKKA